MACYINKYINNVEKRAFFILLLLIFSNMLSSQEISSDTLAFYKAQQKIDSCKSGKMNFTYNYITTSLELHSEIELYFIKNDENKIFIYLKRDDDDFKREYVFCNDTLLIFSDTFYTMQLASAAFEDRAEYAFTYLIDGRLNLVDLLSNDNINLSDTVLTVRRSDKLIIGEESLRAVLNNMDAVVNETICLNNNNSLLSYSRIIQMYSQYVSSFSLKEEYLIDSISLYPEINQDIKDIIMNKYKEFYSIITPKFKNTKQGTTLDTNKKEIPKYAYDWKLPLVNADSLSSKDIKSKILVLDFYFIDFASSYKDLVKLDSLYSDSEVTFVGVNVSDDDIININKFIEDRAIKYRNVLNGRELANKYGFHSFPQVLFIDTKTNEILFHYFEKRYDGFEFYKEKLDRLLENLDKNEK